MSRLSLQLKGRSTAIGLGLILVLLCAATVPDVKPVYTSPVALAADSVDGNIYVADATGSRVLQVDPLRELVVGLIELPESPSGLALNRAADTLYVTSNGAKGTVFVVDLSSRQVRSTLRAGHTPMAPVLNREKSVLYVCNRFDDSLSVLDLKTGAEVARIVLPSEPVAAMLTPDGRTLAVANLHSDNPADQAQVSSTISLIDTRTHRVTARIQLPDGSQGLRGLCLSPDGRYVFVSHILARNHLPATQLTSGWLNTHGVTIIELMSQRQVGTILLDEVRRGAANPWGIVCTPDGEQLYVALSGTHELAILDLSRLLERFSQMKQGTGRVLTNDGSSYLGKVHTDLTFSGEFSQRIPLSGQGPRPLLATTERVYAGMYFSETLEWVDLNRPQSGSHSIGLSPIKPLTSERRGEMLFNDATIAFQSWQSCSTCHHDGRSDGLNWDLTNDGVGNAKNTRSLLFAHATPPLTMTGILPSLEQCVRFELQTILFTKLTDRDADAILAYLESLEPVPSPHSEPDMPDASTRRGRAVFDQAKCSLCHRGPYFTSGEKKIVGTHVLGDQNHSFDIPTLREVWRTAPYLHHGRAHTIREVITTFNPADRHGQTSKLSEQELADLVNYVLTL